MRRMMIFFLLCLLLCLSATTQITYAASSDHKNPIASSNEVRSMKDITQLANQLNMNPQHLRLVLIVSDDLKIASFEEAKAFSMQDLLHVISYIHTGELDDDWQLPLYKISYYVRSGQLVKLISGGHHSVALGPQGEVFTWGYGYDGQLGIGVYENRFLPNEITSFFNLNPGEKIIDISSGDSHLIALSSNHQVFTWGYNYYGQIGNNTSANQPTPLNITSYLNLLEGEYVTGVYTTSNHTMAKTSFNRIFSWGWGVRSQIGDGSAQNRYRPVDITANFNLQEGEYVEDIVGAWGNVMAITNFQRFFGWGYNYDGSVGDGSRINRPYPVDVTQNLELALGETLVQITAGVHHNMLLTSNHRVLGMGYNAYYQIGQGAPYYATLPYDLTSFFPLASGEYIKEVKAGGFFTIAITSNHRVFTWGRNMFGELGNGNTFAVPRPVDVTMNYPLQQDEYIVETSYFFRGHSAFLITSKDRVFGQGRNAYGLLGLQDTYDRLYPVDVTFYQGLNIYEEVYLTWGTDISYMSYPGVEGWYLDEAFSEIASYRYMPACDLILYGKRV